MREIPFLNNYGGDICMASVSWEKVRTASEVKAKFRHNDKEMRCQTSVVHSNEHINKNETWKNTSILGLSYDELCEKYDKRIEYLDNNTNTNKRKDRITCINLEIPVPLNLAEKDYDNWFNDVATVIKTRYGIDNFMECIIHKDEIHEYYDPVDNTYKWSRVHAHFSIIPELNGKLNAKKIETRKEMNILNNAINKMTMDKYKVKFLTGEKKRSRGSVEDCKRKSNEEERKLIRQAKKSLSAQIEELKSKSEKLQEWKTRLSLKEKELDTKETELNSEKLTLDNLVKTNKQTFLDNQIIARKNREENARIQEERSLLKLKIEKLEAEYARLRHLTEQAQVLIAGVKDTIRKQETEAQIDKLVNSLGRNESLFDYSERISKRISGL